MLQAIIPQRKVNTDLFDGTVGHMQTRTTSPLTLLEWETWKLCTAVFHATERHLDACLAADAGLGLTDFNLLSALATAPEQTLQMRQVAQHLRLTPSGATRAVDRLVDLGYVTRLTGHQDRRAAHARLTDAGRTKLRDARVKHLAALREFFFSHLTYSDTQALREAIHKVARRLPSTCPVNEPKANGAPPPTASTHVG